LVALELGDRDEAPTLAVDLAVIGFLDEGHADQPAVVAIGPAVIGAGEAGSVAGIGAAQAIAAMAADVQERTDLPLGAAHPQDRILAHVGAEEVPRAWDLTFVAEEEPAAGEDPLQLLLVDLPLREDAATDAPVLDVDQARDIGVHETLLNGVASRP